MHNNLVLNLKGQLYSISKRHNQHPVKLAVYLVHFRQVNLSNPLYLELNLQVKHYSVRKLLLVLSQEQEEIYSEVVVNQVVGNHYLQGTSHLPCSVGSNQANSRCSVCSKLNNLLPLLKLSIHILIWQSSLILMEERLHSSRVSLHLQMLKMISRSCKRTYI